MYKRPDSPYSRVLFDTHNLVAERAYISDMSIKRKLSARGMGGIIKVICA